MQTRCTLPGLALEDLGRRSVEVTFDAGHVSSDGGLLLLREVDAAFELCSSFASCFEDRRVQEWVEFPVERLIRQRVFALALGYEDVTDHDRLRHDPLLALASGRADLLGEKRRVDVRDRGKGSAGKSTLNRVERAADAATANRRYHKVVVRRKACDDLLVDLFVQVHPQRPERLILDLDASDIALHGAQEGRFWHGYYGHYCYLPQYYFIGEWPVGVRLRTANQDAADGCVEEVHAIVERLRAAWPGVAITLRADSGFARDEIMARKPMRAVRRHRYAPLAERVTRAPPARTRAPPASSRPKLTTTGRGKPARSPTPRRHLPRNWVGVRGSG